MVTVHIGFAADRVGNGVAYARLTTRTGERLVRAAFRVHASLRQGAYRQAQDDTVWERRVAYAAVTALATMLSERGLQHAAIAVPDAELVADRNEHRSVPPPIVLDYVRLGCALNHFKTLTLAYGEDPDLTQRARAEVALIPAA